MIALLLKIHSNYYATKTKNQKYLPYNDVFQPDTVSKSSLMDYNMFFETFIQMRGVLGKVLEEGIMKLFLPVKKRTRAATAGLLQ